MVDTAGTHNSNPAKHVFLSFRGQDTRAGFTTTLYNMLVDNKVETFMDAENLPIGEEISDTLLDAIDKAKVAIVVFSMNYASSSWCLDELSKIIECKDRKDRIGMKVIPVFYQIEPTIIRHQKGPYKTAMDDHEKKYDQGRIKKWRYALISAANLSGLSTNDFKNEYQLMKRILEVASKALITWDEAFKQATSRGHLVSKDVQRKKRASVPDKSVSIDWSDVAIAAAKVAINGKNVKNNKRSEVAPAVAVAGSPPVGIGMSGSTSSGGGINDDDLAFFSYSNKYNGLKNSLKDILNSFDDGRFGMIGTYNMDNKICVAVRRLQGVKLSEKNFKRKINDVEKLQHKNLVRLRAYYFSTDEKLLFYDYMRRGSLYELLHESTDRKWMDWEMRLDIALGAARGIEYIHSHGMHMSHGKINSSNILLAESCVASVSDYCLADLVDPNSTVSTIVDGYRAPEVTDPCKVSQQADVYSFGVVLIELVSGKDPKRPLWKKEEAGLPKWLESVREGEWIYSVIEMELVGDSDSTDKMLQLLRLAVACTASRPSKRPEMSIVRKRIEQIRE